MSDIQKATVSLVLLVESCAAALKGLSEAHDIGDYPTSDFGTLRTDFVTILSIIYAATTKVALSLKPSSPQHKASLVPLKDLTNNVAALVHSIRLMRVKEGATIVQEYEKVARGVIVAVQALGMTLNSSSATSTGTTEEYLVRTGEIHELIDNAKKSGGLSINNRDAVCRIFLRDQDSLLDAAEEIQEMCKPSADNSDEHVDDFDDGWSELGISSSQKPSQVELMTMEKVQTLVKIALLLHKRIARDILSSDARSKGNLALDKLGSFSGKLLAAFDDLISSMYAPQQASNIKLHLGSFQRVIKLIQPIIVLPPNKSLDEEFESLSISSQSRDKNDVWFATCFEQIDNAVSRISNSLEDTPPIDCP
ncbi:hypothetical protein BDN70DRAFT_874529 [Pholiota conissans]|uniref:Cyclin-D1-binding protein 1 n=1 Tax=Pholiota conissans TaxID=109636 RepID=A0A9P5Z9M7_9AGAR|nr:hypothetical protein BDN70DRAFT_874529 [Pholiota conissans]